MRAFGLWMIVVVVALMPAVSRADVFRNFVWGVAPQDVRQFETAPYFDEHDGSLFFTDRVRGLRAVIRYDFDKNALWRIRFDYNDPHFTTPDQMLDRVMSEQERLTKKFGKPVSEELLWRDRYYRRYPQFFERAYGMGHVKITTRWQQGNTAVTLESSYEEDGYTLWYVMENTKAARTPSKNTFNFNLQP